MLLATESISASTSANLMIPIYYFYHTIPYYIFTIAQSRVQPVESRKKYLSLASMCVHQLMFRKQK